MNSISLRQLRYFEALAQHEHFGRAAEACAVSQPALSMQIKELEASLGTALVERAAKKVRLTRFGAEVTPHVRDILRSVEELQNLARAEKEAVAGRFRIGIIPTIAPYLLPSIVGRLLVTFPELDVHLRETLTGTLLADLDDGKLDAAILALPVSEPNLVETPLFEEAFVLVRPQEDAKAPVPDAESLSQMRLLLLEEGHCFRDQALAFCGLRTGLARDGLEGSSLSTLVQMVGSGLGVTLIPELAVPIETRSADVAVARFEDVTPMRQIGLVWRRGHPLAAQFQEIGEVVRAVGVEALERQRIAP